MLFILAPLIIVLYAFVMGLAHPYIASIHAAGCSNCSKGEIYSVKKNGYMYNNCEPGAFHKGETFGRALLWPLCLPYAFASSRDPEIKRGRAAIDAYWEDKAVLDSQKRMKRLENSAGLNH